MIAAGQLSASRLFDGQSEFAQVRLEMDAEGRLLRTGREEPATKTDDTILTPAFLDLHTHGARGYDVMFATPGELAAMQHFFATCGVAFYLPTTVTAGVDVTLRALNRLADAIDRGPRPGEAQPLGVHLEGPFLSHSKRGVHPVEHLQRPSVQLFDRFQEVARGHILLLTLAPELPGAIELIRHATASGVRVSLGHTNATAAETLAALAAGAVSATHTFNAMRPLDHREPGILGTVLDDDRLFAELICDGIHVAPPLARLWRKAKGPDRMLLVTDSMAATGKGDGSYELGGLPVTVCDGRVLLADDLADGRETLAGSVLTMDRAVSNLQRLTGADLLSAVRAASVNPARLLGLPRLATVAAGLPLNLNRFNASGRLVETYLRGTAVVP